jgi:hypothetical protein
LITLVASALCAMMGSVRGCSLGAVAAVPVRHSERRSPKNPRAKRSPASMSAALLTIRLAVMPIAGGISHRRGGVPFRFARLRCPPGVAGARGARMRDFLRFLRTGSRALGMTAFLIGKRETGHRRSKADTPVAPTPRGAVSASERLRRLSAWIHPGVSWREHGPCWSRTGRNAIRCR